MYFLVPYFDQIWNSIFSGEEKVFSMLKVIHLFISLNTVIYGSFSSFLKMNFIFLTLV